MTTDRPSGSPGNTGSPRRFLGLHMNCCRVYVRVYLNASKTAYQGHCPRCARPVRVNIGESGTSDRFFVVD